MKKEMIAVVGSFCAAALFAQSFNTTYYAPNGGYGGSSQTTRNGNSTRTTFYNQNGSYGGSAQTFGAGASTQTTFYNQNGMYGGRHGHPKMAIRSTRPITMQMACMADAPKARLSGTRRPHSTMARTVCRPAGRSRRHSATRPQHSTTISTECQPVHRHSTTTLLGSRRGREVFKSIKKLTE